MEVVNYDPLTFSSLRLRSILRKRLGQTQYLLREGRALNPDLGFL